MYLLSLLIRCYQGAPNAVSSPHFYQAPSFVALDFEVRNNKQILCFFLLYFV